MIKEEGHLPASEASSAKHHVCSPSSGSGCVHVRNAGQGHRLYLDCAPLSSNSGAQIQQTVGK